MADDPISGSIRGPNGETVALRIGSKSLGGNALAVIAILLIGVAALGGVVIAKVLFLGQIAGHETLADIKAVLNANNLKVIEGQHALWLHVDTLVATQNELLNQQIGVFEGKLNKLHATLEGRVDELGRRLDTHDYNALHPDRAIPLHGAAPPSESR